MISRFTKTAQAPKKLQTSNTHATNGKIIMKIKLITTVMIVVAGHIGSAYANFIFTTVVDTPSGSHPRVVEVVATADIADTSDYFFIRQTNGTGTITDTQFGSFTLDAGDFAYITTGGDSSTFLNDNTLGPILASVSSWNGDDILGISSSNESVADASDNASDLVDMIDSFGLFGQADTDFYADGVSTRQAGNLSGTGNGLLDASNFSFSSASSASDAETQALASFGTYVIPEPSIAAFSLIGMALIIQFLRKRK